MNLDSILHSRRRVVRVKSEKLFRDTEFSLLYGEVLDSRSQRRRNNEERHEAIFIKVTIHADNVNTRSYIWSAVVVHVNR